MMDWTALDYEKIANAIVILVVGLAAGLGLRTGRKNLHAAQPAERAVEVAGALIDSSSAKELAAAIEAHTFEMINARKSRERIAEDIGERIKDHGEEISKLILELARHNK